MKTLVFVRFIMCIRVIDECAFKEDKCTTIQFIGQCALMKSNGIEDCVIRGV